MVKGVPDLFQTLANPMFLFTVIVVPLSLVIHEFSHALTADLLGDKTARMAGRLTLNPLAHLELLGLLMMLFAPIGWAKPTPVNPQYFKRPRLGFILTALAGPVSNLVLAALCLWLLKLFWNPLGGAAWNFFSRLLSIGAIINVNLFIFNLIPIPPLDGGQIVSRLLPLKWEYKYQKFAVYGPFLLLLVVMIPPLQGITILPLLRFTLDAIVSVFGFQVPPVIV